jgi:hypothetical protein
MVVFEKKYKNKIIKNNMSVTLDPRLLGDITNNFAVAYVYSNSLTDDGDPRQITSPNIPVPNRSTTGFFKTVDGAIKKAEEFAKRIGGIPLIFLYSDETSSNRFLLSSLIGYYNIIFMTNSNIERRNILYHADNVEISEFFLCRFMNLTIEINKIEIRYSVCIIYNCLFISKTTLSVGEIIRLSGNRCINTRFEFVIISQVEKQHMNIKKDADIDIISLISMENSIISGTFDIFIDIKFLALL